MQLSLTQLAQTIDHTILGAAVTLDDIIRVCAEAQTYHFASVCVAPTYVRLACEKLAGTPIGICTVVGFPQGMNTTAVKSFEAKDAVQNGATEIDTVINIAALKSGKDAYIREELRSIVGTVRDLKPNAAIKIIIETCLLTESEKIKACELVMEGGADFIKTSTGFSSCGATVEDIRLIAGIIGGKIGIKASGGIRDLAAAQAMLAAGATRLGTSAAVKIMEQARAVQPTKA